MKRAGYEENTNKKSVDTHADDAIDIVDQEFRVKDALKERIKKFPMNLVEFLVGLGLLIFCWSYIQSHPAEKSSLFTGLDAVVEKVKVKFVELTTGQSSELQERKQLVKTFDMIIETAESIEGCFTQADLNKIKRAKGKLEALSAEEFVKQSSAFSTVANLFYTKIQEECLENK